MQYLEFLKLLLSLGPKLPALIDAWQKVIEAVAVAIQATQGILPTDSPLTGRLTPLPLTAPLSEEEIDLEDDVASAFASCGPPNALTLPLTGDRLRMLFQLIQLLPQLKALFEQLTR
jgi:hypothetical protein